LKAINNKEMREMAGEKPILTQRGGTV